MSLSNSIEKLVEEQLECFSLTEVRDTKLIRDAVQESHNFNKHEINFIDLPMVQRLRRIHQTGLAFLTYPSATHNRFQHSLGVLVIVNKLTQVLRNGYPQLMNENTIMELRLAALLHDVGHGIFSHPSEEIIGKIPEVEEELHKKSKFSKCKPHEMLSYLMLTTKSFRDFFDEITRIYKLDIDLDNIADMIVGEMRNPDKEAYKSDIINGPFDADKLDYIMRDAYSTGLKMDVDLDRITHTTKIDFRKGKPTRLMVDISGVPNVEQILFNKILLYSSIYHHHKVRATTCMLKSIFEIISDNDLTLDGLSFKTATDFLRIDDCDIFSYFGKTPQLKQTIENMKFRNILKRALVISKRTIDEDSLYNYGRLNRLAEFPHEIRKLRELIVDEMKNPCSIYDIWIDFPEPPSLREPSQCIVRMTDEDYTTLDKIFPADWWLTAYSETKLKGHIFCPADPKIRKDATQAALKIFDQYNIKLKKAAFAEAKNVIW